MSAVAPKLEEALRGLIASALEAPYTSRSGFDGTVTGNHYQSVALGGEATTGFRGDRAAVLDCIDFRGRTVLDLGANLGEMSRSARSRGARLVDGVEYDPFFVELAQLITAYNWQSRVSFRQGDITDPALYDERYDIVLALSVFHYVSRVLDEIAAITDVLLIETHKLHGNFSDGYLMPIQERFPAMRVLGQTDWGQLGDGSETRLVVLFAKDPETLGSVLTAPHAWGRPPSAPAPRRSERVIDPRASVAHDGFFEAWDYASPAELLAAVERTEIPLDALAANGNLAHGYSGWAYWFLYLKGWLHWRETGVAGAGNPYFEYMTVHYAPHGADAAVGRLMRDAKAAEAAIRRRFADLDRFHAADGNEVAGGTPPLRAIVGAVAPREPLTLVEPSGEAIPARRLDGWHRLFGARALGVPRLRVEVVEESRALPALRGALDVFAMDGDTARVSGWCLDPDGPLDAVELRHGGETVALAVPHEREDVARAHPALAHAGAAGFRLEGRIHGWDPEQPARLELLGIRDWMPVGRLRIDWEPAMATLPRPPAELVAQVYGNGAQGQFLARTAIASNALLDAVAHYRLLDTFRDVLHWDAGVGLLLPLAARRLSEASATALVADADARAWMAEAGISGAVVALPEEPPTELEEGAADLVLRDRPLAALSQERLGAWLGELRRVLRPGGYGAAVAGWTTGERTEMLARCGDQLDVVGVAPAAAWGGEIVVLRRP